MSWLQGSSPAGAHEGGKLPLKVDIPRFDDGDGRLRGRTGSILETAKDCSPSLLCRHGSWRSCKFPGVAVNRCPQVGVQVTLSVVVRVRGDTPSIPCWDHRAGQNLREKCFFSPVATSVGPFVALSESDGPKSIGVCGFPALSGMAFARGGDNHLQIGVNFG